MSQASKLKQTLFVCEGWLSVSEVGKLPGVPPSQDPNRKEVVILAGPSLSGTQTEAVFLEIITDATDEPIELRPLSPVGEGKKEMESWLSSAFIAGFQLGRSKS